KVPLSGADQRVSAFVRQGEDKAAVGVLEHVSAAMIEQFRYHDVNALDEARTPMRCRLNSKTRGECFLHPRAGGIDERLCRDDVSSTACLILDGDLPMAVPSSRHPDFGAGADGGAAISGIAGVEYNQTRVVRPAIGKREASAEFPGLQRDACRIAGKVEHACRRQPLTPAHVIVDEQSE